MLKEFRQDKLLCKVYKTRAEMGMAAAEDVRERILALLEEKEELNMIFAAAPSPNEVLAALLVIEENFRDIKGSDIAKKLFISNSHFSKLFAAECGVTPLNYLLLRKIAEAKKYLYMGISVKEACLLSGFSDYSNFIRTFKNIEGCSPGSFEALSKPL